MKQFIGDCVENPFGRIETLVKITEGATSISKLSFLKQANIPPSILSDMHQSPNDYKFYRYSTIYFYTWSAIEHFYS